MASSTHRSSSSVFVLLLSIFTLLITQCIAQPSSQVTFQAPSSPLSSIPRSSFKLTSLTRNVELGGATSKATTVYSLKPSTSSDDELVFVFALEGREAANLSWIEASTGRTGNTKKAVQLERVDAVNGETRTQYYKAILPQSSSSSNSDGITLSVQTQFNHYTTPKPATLVQEAANQGMQWESNLLGGHIVNPEDELPKDSIKVRVKCPTPRAAEDLVPPGWTVSHTPGSAFIQFTNTETISATSGDQIASIHYEQPEPVLSIRKLDRTIQVSHWGNHVAVEDEILLVNDGPKLKGHFSRLSHQALSYQRRGAAFVTPHTATSISYSLPPNVYSPYFIDEVGNVSTSRFRPSPTKPSNTASLKSKPVNLGKSHLQLTPRYPLLGGWNYSFSMGYKQPLGDVLRYDAKNGEYKLAVPFLTELKNAAFDDVTVRLVLPEGAHDIKVSLPFQVKSSSTNTTYSYLDTSGRPTVTLHNEACSAEIHSQDVIVSYKFSSADLLQKPAAVAALALVAFVVLGLGRKVSWTIKA